jgi:hypothetical protein
MESRLRSRLSGWRIPASAGLDATGKINASTERSSKIGIRKLWRHPQSKEFESLVEAPTQRILMLKAEPNGGKHGPLHSYEPDPKRQAANARL